MQTNIPSRLGRLPELAYNLFWTWTPEARRLFSRLDPDLWVETERNPVHLLQKTDRLEAAAGDADFVDAYHQVLRSFDDYLAGRETWVGYAYPEFRGPVAYFSAEFGLHESLPVYSGGLGVLAGDHVKSASDLGLPLVGVGILYAQGFFRQRLDEEGRQVEVYEPFDPGIRPVEPARNPDGGEVVVSIEMPGRELYLKVWRVAVGRATVLLLDADIPENAGEDRQITGRLYGGDNRTRIAQELILGVGGVRALRATGLRPAVYHMNEGHAAFLGLERIRELVAAGANFDDARREVAQSTVFTTHTPSPAGHDVFAPELLREFTAGWPQRLGTDDEGLLNLGREEEDWGPVFNMTALAINLSAGRNAVSKLHQEVSLEMWGHLFEENGQAPGDRSTAGPEITAITNGVHTWSWLSAPMAELYEYYSGGRAWRRSVQELSAWSFVEEIPSRELWEAHNTVKREMVDFVNERLRIQRERTGAGGEAHELDPEALTIGFARRFATYKRATLSLHDPDRLREIVRAAGRPVQFVFAGKAHPADSPAKEFIQELYRAAGEEDLAGHLFILEDYDMGVTRHLVQGVDVWLNTPRRPLEASGTSGQKASLNGAPNFSVLDGWWPEAYNGRNGWTIGEGKEYPTREDEDAADAASFYETLENDLIPTFHDRNPEGVPEAWVAVMKEAIGTVAPTFSTQRMVRDYIHRLYAPRTAGRI